MIKPTAAALLAIVPAAYAQDQRPAPAYLSNMFAQVYAAETLAHWCPKVAVNDDTVQKAWLKVFERLDADGYDTNREDGGMADPSDAIGAAVEDWATKRRLTEASEISEVCRAANQEIAERTLIGSFLKRTAG